MSTKELKKILIAIVTIVVLVSATLVAFATATDLQNTPDQYMELKVVSIEDDGNGDKQIIMEWWSHNLKMVKGADVRFAYDDTKVEPSSISDNAYNRNNFEFDSKVRNYMDYLVYPSSVATDGTKYYRGIMSLTAVDEDGNYDGGCEYIEHDTATDSYILNTNVPGGVLLGRMSFRLFNGQIDNTTFSLLPSSATNGLSAPNTGIQISRTITNAYDDNDPDTGVFRFTVLSSDATLSGLDYEYFNYEDDGAGNLNVLPSTIGYSNTYTNSINLSSPDSVDSTNNINTYNLTLNEMQENISLKITPNESNATIKVNSDNVTWNTDTKELVLKALGSKDAGGNPEDTVIDIEVTAQDGSTKQTYRLVIHRPFGTIKGSVYTAPTVSTNIYKSNVRIYNNSEVTSLIDWSQIIDPDVEKNIHTNLLSLTSQDYITQDDGNFEIYVLPGTYDVLLDKQGYLDCIHLNKTLIEGTVIDLGQTELLAGDLNKDGVVDIGDVSLMNTQYLLDDTSSDYLTYKYYDFNEDLVIDISDSSFLNTNYLKEIEVK